MLDTLVQDVDLLAAADPQPVVLLPDLADRLGAPSVELEHFKSRTGGVEVLGRGVVACR